MEGLDSAVHTEAMVVRAAPEAGQVEAVAVWAATEAAWDVEGVMGVGVAAMARAAAEAAVNWEARVDPTVMADGEARVESWVEKEAVEKVAEATAEAAMAMVESMEVAVETAATATKAEAVSMADREAAEAAKEKAVEVVAWDVETAESWAVELADTDF